MVANNVFVQIAAEYASKEYEDFAVVIQPFLSKVRPDQFPVEFLSSVMARNLFSS